MYQPSYLFIIDNKNEKFYRKYSKENKTCESCKQEIETTREEWAKQAGQELADFISEHCFEEFAKGLRERLIELS